MNKSKPFNNDNNIVVWRIDKQLKTKLVSSHLQCKQHNDVIQREFLIKTINKLGKESAKAQDLQIPITTVSKFTSNSCDDLIYMITNCDLLVESISLDEIGFIRMGRRHLYFDDGTSLRQIPNCPCILDFYVRFKRLGYGKILFDIVLDQLKLRPEKLAYDRPSSSMISFLERHYRLNKPQLQHNHFAIFSDIFI